jgi:transcriptional antiterminator RfaH
MHFGAPPTGFQSAPVINPMPWYCLHTKPMKEVRVSAYCTHRLGLETCLPHRQREKSGCRQRSGIIWPLFPRYLFCRFDPAVSLRAVRYAPDVIDVVCTGNTPAMVADALIENLKALASDRIANSSGFTFNHGDAVEVVTGPMQGLCGTILGACSEQDRVKLLLSFLQCDAQLNVDRSEIKRIL